MRAFPLVFLAVIGVAVSLVAQSPPPTPTPTKAGQEKKEISNTEDRQTNSANSAPQTSSATVNQPSPAPTQSNTDSNGAPNRDKPPTKWKWNVINTAIVTIFTIVLAAVGILQWLSMRAQARYMRDGLKVTEKSAGAAADAARATESSVIFARENARLEQRAWVTVEKVFLVRPLIAGDEHVRVRLCLRNSGKTPALKTRVIGAAYFACMPSQIVDAGNTSEATIGPDSNWHTDMRLHGGAVQAHEIQELRNERGGNSIYATGKITYCDIFGGDQYTDFCFFIRGSDLADLNFGACPTGNTVKEAQPN